MDRRALVRPALIRAALPIVVGAVALDQLTKWWAESSLKDGDTIELLPTLEFDLAYNSGFSFGTAEGFGNWIGVLVIGLCLFLIQQIAVSEYLGRARILAVILGGAIGNLIDRIFRADDGPLSGEVIDFIDVSWYAVFNVADMFVVCGMIVFVLYELRTARAEAAATSADDGASDDDEAADDGSDETVAADETVDAEDTPTS